MFRLKKYENKMTILRDFLGTLRTDFALVKNIDPSSVDACNNALAKWSTHGEHMMMHQEGVKAMKSGMKSITLNTVKV